MKDLTTITLTLDFTVSIKYQQKSFMSQKTQPVLLTEQEKV